MTIYRTHVTHEQVAWPLVVQRRRRAVPVRRFVQLRRGALGWFAVAVFEAVLLGGTVTVLLGLGFEGLAGTRPEPAPAPTYELVPAPVPDAGPLLAAAPLPAPAPLVAPEPVAAEE